MPADDQTDGGAMPDPLRETVANRGSAEVGEAETIRPAFHEEATLAGPPDSSQRAAPSTTQYAPPADIDALKRAIAETGLIDGEELDRFASASAATDVGGLARALVQAGKLTAYQAGAVLQGKAKGLLIGNYLVLDKLGAGGMGVVFKARHARLGRVVALKILPPSFGRDYDAVMRFRREVEVAARITHPNVVAALDADEDRGVHFLAMEYIQGRDLDRIVDAGGPLPVALAVHCTIQAAQGLAAAHAQGVVHRDVKPGNLMLDDASTVRVLDLGLAKVLDTTNAIGQVAGKGLTRSGSYMGTIDYMAPEQADDSSKADHRADIYALGCSLFFLLTGRPPFEGDTVLKRLLAHQERPAPSLRAARPEVPEALDAVYQKMMAKRPGDRPASMAAVAALLEQAQTSKAETKKANQELKTFADTAFKRAAEKKGTHEPSVLARRDGAAPELFDADLNLEDLVMDLRPEQKTEASPISPLRSAKRAAPPRTYHKAKRRHLPVVVLGGLASVGVVAALLLFSRRGTDTPTRVPEPQLASKTKKHGPRVAEPPAVGTIFDGVSPTGWMLCDGKALPQANVQQDGLNPKGLASALAVCQKKVDNFILDFDYKLSPGANTGVFLRVNDLNDPIQTGLEVQLWDKPGMTDETASGAFYGLVAPRAHPQKPAGAWNAMTITADGPKVSVSLNGEEVSDIDLDGWTAAGFKPDGSPIAKDRFRNVAFGSLARTGFIGFQNQEYDCWFKNVRLRPIPAAAPAVADAKPLVPLAEVGVFVGHETGIVEAVAVVPGGRSILTTGQDRTMRQWDVRTGRELRRFWHPENPRPVAALPDGHRALTGSKDSKIYLWDLDTGREIHRFEGHKGIVWAVAVSPDGKHALSGGSDGTLRLWDLQTRQQVRLWDLQTRQQVRKVQEQRPAIFSVAFSPVGTKVIAGYSDGVVRLGDIAGGDGALQELKGASDFIWDAAFSPDGRQAVSSSSNGHIVVWDLAKGREVRSHIRARSMVRTVAFTSDGRQVLYGIWRAKGQGVLGTWEPETPGRHRETPGTGHPGLALLPDGPVVTADSDNLVRLWYRSAELAAARNDLQKGKYDAALDAYGKAIASHRSEPRLLIERGRLLAELGRGDAADADFQSAASLAPDDPQLFLDAGWWVAGPYPRTAGYWPIEKQRNPDPARPPPAVAGQARQWRRVPIGARGAVNLRNVFDADNVESFALALAYAAKEQWVVFPCGFDDLGVVWLNGQKVLDAPRSSETDGYFFAVRLQRGRNTVLVKVTNDSGPYGFNMRISDDPTQAARANAVLKAWKGAGDAYERAIARDPTTPDVNLFRNGGLAFAEQGQWKKAADAFQRATKRDPNDFPTHFNLAFADLAQNNEAAYRRVLSSVLPKVRVANRDVAHQVAFLATATPDALTDYGNVLAVAKRAVDVSPDTFTLDLYGALLYRAKKYSSAANYLKKAIDADKGRGSAFSWAFLAMAQHRQIQPGDREALQKARGLEKDVPDWYGKVAIRHILREADIELGIPQGPGR